MRTIHIVISVAIAMLIATQPLAAGTPGEYLVATRARPGPDLLGAYHKRSSPIVPFRSVNGFAATLTDDQVASLRDHPDVLWVEKDPPRYLFAEPVVAHDSVSAAPEAAAQSVPYGVTMVKASAVWHLTRGSGVKVGIVDTGIDLGHPDLETNIDGGRSFLPFDTTFQDQSAHGTHVAGTVGAIDNDFGVVGVAPASRLYALRVFNQNGDFVNASALIEIIDWAIENGVTILNMSLGGPESAVLEAKAFEKARDNGIFIAAAVGNTGDAIPQYPAAYPGAFGVGSVDSSGRIAASSTYGSFVDVVAPGVGVLSTVPVDTSRAMLLKNSVLGEIEGSLLSNSPRGVLSGEWVACGIGRPQDFPTAVNGRIALIQRGDLLFAEKSANAKAAGAIAVVIYNNLDGIFNGTLGSDPFDFPLTIGISKADGEALLKAGASVFESSTFQPYGFNSGTSMASPHVAGAAALLRALAPDASTTEIENALTSTAHDLGDPGYDVFYGYGLIDIVAAARAVAPEKFTSRRRPVRR